MLAQEFMVSTHDYDIEEEEEIHGFALPHQSAPRDMESTGRHPFRHQIVRLSKTADIKFKWRVLLQPGIRHALCYDMLIQAIQQVRLCVIVDYVFSSAWSSVYLHTGYHVYRMLAICK